MPVKNETAATLQTKLDTLAELDLPEAATVEKVVATGYELKERFFGIFGALIDPEVELQAPDPAITAIPVFFEHAHHSTEAMVRHPGNDSTYTTQRAGYLHIVDTTKGYRFPGLEREEAPEAEGYVLLADGTVFKEAVPRAMVSGSLIGLPAAIASNIGNSFRFREADQTFSNRSRVGAWASGEQDLAQFSTDILEKSALYLDEVIDRAS